MRISEFQFDLIRREVAVLPSVSEFYRKKYEGVDVNSVRTLEDFQKLPFLSKEDLREAYPMGLAAVPADRIVRVHSSSGTTGTPVIIPYTAKDVEDWAVMMERCLMYAGVTRQDIVQITPGYGLNTSGIGFQTAVERLGAMALPIGPGNTDKQLKMMTDLGSTVIGATASYALVLAEEIAKRGIGDKIKLRTGLIGSERCGPKMRERIKNELGIEYHELYGITEIYGPGVAVSCKHDCGMHIWTDFYYIEIIDPVTGEVLPDGEIGELVFTTLRKEGAPLIRYRTHDLTRIIPGDCPCGSEYPRIDEIFGRSDDMVKIKGVGVFPGQVDSLLADVPFASSEFRLVVDRKDGRDTCGLEVEILPGADPGAAAIASEFRKKTGISAIVRVSEIGSLPRSEGKTKRVIDKREY
ncbi:MAG: phenylacetate--CoA ligase [Clostridia bacterium]|nr:phenylacetate--CoA ligase [Clostridia bacterium]